jgi:hypothetical protein
MARPAVTWGQLAGWTRANEVPGDAIVCEETPRFLYAARRDGGRVFLLTKRRDLIAVPETLVTWAQLQEMGTANGWQDSDELWLDGHHFADDVKVLDLGYAEADPSMADPPGERYLVIQRRWG